MKSAILTCVVSLVFASSVMAAGGDGTPPQPGGTRSVATAAEKAAKNRTLVARHSAGAVTVKIRFVQGDAEEDEGFAISYLCPNCDRLHYHGLDDFVGGERPFETIGYVTAPDRVVMQDYSIRSNFIASVSVECAGVEYPAVVSRRYPAQEALELKTAKPIAGAKPYAFRDAKGGAAAKFFYTTREKGLTISGVVPAEGLRVRHYAELGKDLMKLPGSSVVLDAEGEPISLSFRAETPYDDVAFTAPTTWKGEEPKLFDERIAALKKKLSASLVPVYIHREVEKQSSRGSSRRMFIDGEEMGGDGKTDLDTLGYAIENGELLVPLDFNASQTAEIDKMEAVLANGSRVPLEYVGAFDRYALAVFRFAEGKMPDGVKPLKFRTRPCSELYATTIYSTAVRSLDGRLVFNLTPEKVQDFSVVRGGTSVPDVRMNGSRGRQSFAVNAEGEFVVGRFNGRSTERWSSNDSKVAAADLMKLVSKREFNPEYALRKGKDRIRVAWIGVETQSLTSDLAREKKAAGLLLANRSSGALVRRVHADTPAAKAGLKEGDILLYVRRKNEAKRVSLDARDSFGGSMFDLAELLDKIDGERLGMLDADRFAPWPDVEAGVNETFSRIGIGAEVVVAYARDGEKQEATMKLAQAPVHFRSAKRLRAKDMGAAFVELTFEVRGYFKLADDAPGVVVCKVQPGNPAAVAGLKPLEIVTHVDDKPVKTLKEFGDLVRGKTTFSLSVRRLEKTRVVRIKLGEKNAQDK